MLRNQSGGAAAEVLLKFCLVFVISLFAFAVGTFVGKKFTEDQHRLAELDGQKRQAASIADLDEVIQPESAISDADIESLSQEFSESENAEIAAALSDREVAAEDLAEKALEQLDKDLENLKKENGESANAKSEELSQQEKQQNKTANNMKQKASDEASKVATRIAKNKKQVVVAPKKEMDRRPSSYPKLQASASAGKYTVQVASYKSEAEAKNMVNQLNTKGYTAFYVEAKVKGNHWYRVSVGLFTNQASANDYMKKLYEEAKLKGFVTKVTR